MKKYNFWMHLALCQYLFSFRFNAVLATLLISFGSLNAQQTLCQTYGSNPANLVIGVPAANNPNQQQSITFLSVLYPNGTTLQNQKIRINGVLKVDRNLTFDNCTVEFESGSQIVTDGSNAIVSFNSRFGSALNLVIA
jgi:hypothetical protein